MRFEFATATRIIFGAGTLPEAGALAKGFGRHAFVVTGSRVERAERLLQSLRQAGCAVTVCLVSGEPTTGAVMRGVAQARTAGCDVVVSFGGGSVIDAGKAIAALLTNTGELLDYLEVIGQGKPLQQAPVPFIAIPTTAGAGAEVTRNAVLTAKEQRVKVSLRSAMMLPRVALVDPGTTLDLPRTLTASTGLDALTQLIEPFVSCKANPMTDAICREGMQHAARSLKRACDEGHDLVARTDMAFASLCGGLALANAALGAVHGFAAPLGGMFPAPHGAVCAALLPQVMETNLQALQRAGNTERAQRFEEIARLLTGKPAATAAEGIAWVKELCRELQIPALRTYGITRDDFAPLIAKAALASSMKGNPAALSAQELHEVLERAW